MKKKKKRQTWARKREGIYEEGKYGRENSTENVKKGKKENMGDKTKLDGKREKKRKENRSEKKIEGKRKERKK